MTLPLLFLLNFLNFYKRVDIIHESTYRRQMEIETPRIPGQGDIQKIRYPDP